MKCCIKPIGSTAQEQWFLSLCACVTVWPCGCLLQNQDGEFRDGVAILSSFTDFCPVSLSNSFCFDFPPRKIEFSIPFFLSWFPRGWSRTVMLPLLSNLAASRVGTTYSLSCIMSGVLALDLTWGFGALPWAWSILCVIQSLSTLQPWPAALGSPLVCSSACVWMLCASEKCCFCGRKTLSFSFKISLLNQYFQDVPEQWLWGGC